MMISWWSALLRRYGCHKAYCFHGNSGTTVLWPHFLSVCAGLVTNAVIMAAPANMFLPDSRPAVPLPCFSRHLHASEGDSGELGDVCVRLGLYTQVSPQVKRGWHHWLYYLSSSATIRTNHAWLSQQWFRHFRILFVMISAACGRC